eukprot:Rhum_TRINITY_DN14246_c9_g2::Rhum_TRINITY_DN14246_c9_g2_i1::g.75759::m.75759
MYISIIKINLRVGWFFFFYPILMGAKSPSSLPSSSSIPSAICLALSKLFTFSPPVSAAVARSGTITSSFSAPSRYLRSVGGSGLGERHAATGGAAAGAGDCCAGAAAAAAGAAGTGAAAAAGAGAAGAGDAGAGDCGAPAGFAGFFLRSMASFAMPSFWGVLGCFGLVGSCDGRPAAFWGVADAAFVGVAACCEGVGVGVGVVGAARTVAQRQHAVLQAVEQRQLLQRTRREERLQQLRRRRRAERAVKREEEAADRRRVQRRQGDVPHALRRRRRRRRDVRREDCGDGARVVGRALRAEHVAAHADGLRQLVGTRPRERLGAERGRRAQGGRESRPLCGRRGHRAHACVPRALPEAAAADGRREGRARRRSGDLLGDGRERGSHERRAQKGHLCFFLSCFFLLKANFHFARASSRAFSPSGYSLGFFAY